MLAANGNLKISDFGLCAVFKHKGRIRLLSGRCGSLPYVAPEVSTKSDDSGYWADVISWADRMDRVTQLNQWIYGVWEWCYIPSLLAVCGVDRSELRSDTPWDEPSENSPEFVAFLSGELLKYDPWTRIPGQARGACCAGDRESAEGVCIAILLGMLTVDPIQRITMKGINSHPWCMT